MPRNLTLTFDERCEERDVGGLPPARRQRHPDLVQLVPEHPPSVLRLRPGIKMERIGDLFCFTKLIAKIPTSKEG